MERSFAGCTSKDYYVQQNHAPTLIIFTFFGNTGDCVNLGATGMFQAAQIGALADRGPERYKMDNRLGRWSGIVAIHFYSR